MRFINHFIILMNQKKNITSTDAQEQTVFHSSSLTWPALSPRREDFSCFREINLSMDLDAGAERVESSAERDLAEGEDAVVEPYVGMEFDSEDAAKDFYDEYSRHVGFVVRIDQCRRSEVDKRILSRRFSCNKQGHYLKARDEFGPLRKPRTSTREGCKAMMLVKVNKAGKWAVTRFVKDHTHPLVVSSPLSHSAVDGKDRRIQELATEVDRQDRLCELYRGQLITFLKNVEEQTELLSTKIQVVVDTVREFELNNNKSTCTTNNSRV